MRLNKLTNIVIVILSLSAMYLTGQLWFETLSNRNFFYSMLSALNFGSAGNGKLSPHIIKPYRLILNNGTSNFYIAYDNINANQNQQTCDSAIGLILRKGEFVSETELDWNRVLSSKSYIYDYSFPVSAAFFAEAYGQKTINLSAKIQNIDAISIAPGLNSPKKLTATFIDSANRMCYTYDAVDNDINDALLEGFNQRPTRPDGVFYVSSVQNGLTMFTDNNFVPQWLGESLGYNVLRLNNPYAPKGDPMLHTIQPNIEYLFDSVVYSGTANGVYTYSDENTVVRYYPNNVLEYSDYHIIDKALNPTMASNYRAALAFLERDTLIENDYYLSGLEASDNTYTFYFDYNVNNYPLKLPKTYAEDIKMKAPIIITAENNNVFKYKKLVYTYYDDEDYDDTASISFIDSYNAILPEGADSSSLQIDTVTLAYKMDAGKYIRMHWFMDINDVCIVNPAQFTREE